MPRGGPRPGAGAPQGNMNAFKHGRNVVRFQALAQALSQVPEIRETFEAQARARRRSERQARRAAAELLALVLGGAPADPRSLTRLQDNELLFLFVFTYVIEEAAKRRFQSKGGPPFQSPTRQ